MNQNSSRTNKTGAWRRLLSVVLAVCMVISMTPAVMAEDNPAVTTTPSELPVAEEIMPSEPVPEVTAPAETEPAEPVPETTAPVEPSPEVTDPADTQPEPPATETSASENPQVQLIKQLISALPAEVTGENAEEVRARLQEILNLYSQLLPEEQEAVDITPCFMLQAQLEEIDSAATLADGSTPVTENDTEWTTGTYTVNSNVTLKNRITVNGDVTLILGDGCTLTASQGITVNKGNSLTIEGNGSLYSESNAIGWDYACIGGSNQEESGGTVIINGGNITAINTLSAAIGSGDSTKGGEVIINGGTVYACSSNAAAIGGGSWQDAYCNVTINGGNVRAISKKNSAAIGGSDLHAGHGTVKITGGTVYAECEGSGPAIGVGTSTDKKVVGWDVIISGGFVTAKTSSSTLAIGYGNKCTSTPPTTFSTGENGNAVILAFGANSKYKDGSIVQDGKANWKGFIFDGIYGGIYGTDSYVLNNSINIDNAHTSMDNYKTLTIKKGQTLTISDGVTYTNDGVIAIEYGGTINGNGIITGSGSFTTENLTEDMIILPADLAYNGEDRSNEISENISYGITTICGQVFTFDSTKWKVDSVTTADNYNYSVEFVYNDTESNYTESKTFSISLAQSGTEFAEGSVAAYKNDAAATEFTYGETVTVKAKPVPTGTAPVTLASTRLRGTPIESQMALYYGDIQISEPANADANGLYTMTVPVSALVEAGAGYDAPVTLTAKFIGDEKMDDAEATVEITLCKAQLTAAATIAEKMYDGTNTAAVSSVTFTGSDGNAVELGKADYTAAAEFADANAGENKLATVTVTLSENLNYTLTASTINATGTVTVRTLTEEDITVTLDNDTYTWAGEEIKPIPTLTWNNNGTAVTIASSEYAVSYGYNGNETDGLDPNTSPRVIISCSEGGNYSFEEIYKYFTIICNHQYGCTNGACSVCGEKAAIEVMADGETPRYYFSTGANPIDEGRMNDILAEAENMYDRAKAPVTVKLNQGWAVPKFNLSTYGKLNLVADSYVEFTAGSITVGSDSDSAELTVDAAGGSFGAVSLYGDSSKFTMNSGSIAEVSLNGSSEFIMNGGTVRGKIFVYGEAAKVTVTGGEVKGELVACPGTDLTITGGTIGTLRYNGTGTVTNTKLSGGSFTTITLPEGEQVGSILADGYAFYDSTTKAEVTNTTVCTLSNVFVAKAGSHVVSADLDFTGEVTNPGDLATDGYHWESLPDTSGEENKICTLTLNNCIIPGNIILPDNAESITIKLQGDSSVGGFVSVRSKYGDNYYDPIYKYNLIITGDGTLNVGGMLGGSGSNDNQITIKSGANVTVSGNVQYGASGGVDGVLTVNGSLTVNAREDTAISGGRLVIGASGNLSVSGARGVLLGGTREGFADTFVINEGAVFTANCTDYNIWVYSYMEVTDDVTAIVSIPEGYIADGYAVRYVNNGMFGLSVVPQSTPDSSLLNGTGMGGYLALKHQLHYAAVIEGESHVYSGEEITPAVTVTCEGTALTEGTDYTVTYMNNVTPGTATVIIKGINNPDLNITKTFEITCTHTAGNKDTGVCDICHKQMVAGVLHYDMSTYSSDDRFFDNLEEAWECALSKECDGLFIYEDVTVSKVLEIPADKELNLYVENNKTLTGTAASTIDVYGRLELGEGTIRNANNCSIRVYANAVEDGYTGLIMTDIGKTVDGVEVYGTGEVILRACNVTHHITVPEGRTVGELLYSRSAYYKSETGEWVIGDALNATSLGPVDIVDAPIWFYNVTAENRLNFEYMQGSTSVNPIESMMYNPSQDVEGLTIRWYKLVDGTETLIDGAAGRTYTPDVSEAGTTQYFCEATLDGYTTRTQIFTVKVIKKVTVALTSQLTGDDSGVTIGNLTGGGEYTSGDSVTVTAPAVDGCAFDGWYDGNTLASPNLSYTFTAADDVELVAKYTANDKAVVSITGANGAKFFVEGIATSQSVYDQHVAIGTKLKLTAEEPDKVSSWVNGSNKIIGTGASIEFTVTGSTSIKLMYKANDEGKAMVEFISDYGQLLSCQSYSSTETIIEPVAPSKLGYTFNGWNPAIEDIPDMIQNGVKHITVRPVYTQSTNSFKAIIHYPDNTSSEVPGAEGEIVTITAKEIEGLVFAYWTDESNRILSYDKNYFVKLSSDVVLIANYTAEAQDAEPIIAITAKYASEINGKKKVSFAATRSVPEGYTIVEHGIIFVNDSSLAQEDKIVLNGTNVKKSQSNDLSNNGVYTINISVGTHVADNLYVRGYMIVRNSDTGNNETIYTAIDFGNYNELNAKEQEAN